jgi:enoyl-CoA hydratase/carnithine racemase
MTVDYEQDGPVVVVRLNRPERANSFDGPTAEALGDALRRAAGDDVVRAVVLTGAGDKVFCAGMDLKAFAEGQIDSGGGFGTDVIMKHEYPKPVVAAVNGTAVGGGFELALACDLIIAAEHARFGLPEVTRGLLAAGGGTALPLRLPLAIALELGLTGEYISAARAYELGLVNRVVPGGAVLNEAIAIAGRIARNGPLAVRATKRLMRVSIGTVEWDRIEALAALVMESADAVEGATAFAARREPQWTGR